MMANSSSEQEVQRLARTLYQQAARHKPALFEAQDLLGKMIDWSLNDESLRVALFRFVDVLPSLESSAEIGRHLEEYFARVDHALGGLAYLAQALRAGTLVAPLVRRNVVTLARRFIAEESGDHLSQVLSQLRNEPAAFTLDVVGEATVSDREAAAMQQRYLELLRRLAGLAQAWPVNLQIDESPAGVIPRVNLSVKLSSLCARFDPLDPNTESIVRQRLRELFREAARLGAALTVDMEQYAFKDLTLAIFRSVLEDDEFRQSPYAAIALQAYLKDSEKDLGELIRWARRHKRPIGVRLVKGAYWDSEIAWAKQKNWPIPVYLEKNETDANYERLSRLLLENGDVIQAAFGSHNLRSLAHAIVTAKELGVPPNGYEIQMLYGMAEPVRRAIIDNGQRVRVYLPVGELLPGISYLIRRLMENTSNTSFLRQTYAEKKDVESLIRLPAAAANKAAPKSTPVAKTNEPRAFVNEPLIDFSRSENRQRFARTLDAARAERLERVAEEPMQLVASRGPITLLPVRHPGHVGAEQQVELREALTGRLRDPLRAAAVVVAAVHDGADEIGVQDQEPARQESRFVFTGNLAERDRLDVGAIERTPLAIQILPRELGGPDRAVVRRQLARERRLSRRLRPGHDHSERLRHGNLSRAAPERPAGRS
jgi:RHH-type proline utilization regulon transcriptional repressor/proline dehydrogenase/delta 1-pyrroline-5-carboxylate dehydrogenase